MPASGARLALSGSLERIDARLSAEVAGIPAEAHALVTPFSAERLQAIEARGGPIDLARFGGPNTALNASVKGETMSGGGAPRPGSFEKPPPRPGEARRPALSR